MLSHRRQEQDDRCEADCRCQKTGERKALSRAYPRRWLETFVHSWSSRSRFARSIPPDSRIQKQIPPKHYRRTTRDRKSVVKGKSVSVRLDLGGRSVMTDTSNKIRIVMHHN